MRERKKDLGHPGLPGGGHLSALFGPGLWGLVGRNIFLRLSCQVESLGSDPQEPNPFFLYPGLVLPETAPPQGPPASPSPTPMDVSDHPVPGSPGLCILLLQLLLLQGRHTLLILCFISGHLMFPDFSCNPWSTFFFLLCLGFKETGHRGSQGGPYLCRQLVSGPFIIEPGPPGLLTPQPLSCSCSSKPGLPQPLFAQRLCLQSQQPLLASSRRGRSSCQMELRVCSSVNLSLCICSFPPALRSPEPLPLTPPPAKLGFPISPGGGGLILTPFPPPLSTHILLG